MSSRLVLAGALYQLGLLDGASLCSELERSCAGAWKAAFLPAGADPLGGLCYWPLHEQFWDVEDLFMRTLRDAFANEWCASEGSVSLDYLKDAFTAAGQTQRFDVSAEMAALLLRLTSLVQILERMHAAANWCEQIAGQPGQQARSGIAEVAAGLTNSLDALKGSAAQYDCSIFRPVVHYLELAIPRDAGYAAIRNVWLPRARISRGRALAASGRFLGERIRRCESGGSGVAIGTV